MTAGPILIGGCPRSGTSWIHFLVASHPDTVTVRETHVYDKYVGPLRDWFEREETLEAADGLSALFDEEDFLEKVLRPIVGNVFEAIKSKASADAVVVEKTPGNMLYHDLIHRLQPDARLLVVLRDPRAVYSSYKAAGKQEWGGWTRKSTADFCQSWNRYAAAYLTARSYWSEDRLLLVRYEDMQRDGVAELSRVFEWAKLPPIDGLAEEALERNRIDTLRELEDDPLRADAREGFYRCGKAFRWLEELSTVERNDIEVHCRDLMKLLGYARRVTLPLE